jgi:hypothetical protein
MAPVPTVMTQLAMQEANDDGNPVKWSDHVTDKEYGTGPSTNPVRH